MDVQLKEQEKIDNLMCSSYRIIQRRDGPCLGTDTVLLADFARVKDREVVIDLGTGIGVIPLLLAASTNVGNIVGLEIQEDLADTATRNVLINHLSERVKIIQGDIRDVKSFLAERKFDVALSNPPYIEVGRGLMSHADVRVVAKHEVRCTMKDVIESCRYLVKSKGRIILSYRPERLVDLITLLRRFLFEPKRVRFVHSHYGEEARLVLIEAVREGQSGLRIASPLFVHAPDGSFTQEVKDIYALKARSSVGTGQR